MTKTADSFSPCDTRELVSQLGRMNLLSISGGRVLHRETGAPTRTRKG